MQFCPHCGKEIIEDYAKSSLVPCIHVSYNKYVVEELNGLAKEIFGRPKNINELEHWKKSLVPIKNLKGMDYYWDYDEEKGLLIYSTSYSMFFNEPFPDIWFFFLLPDDNLFRQRFFKNTRLVMEENGEFWTEKIKNGKWIKRGTYGMTGKDAVEKYKKRIQGVVPAIPCDDTFTCR